MILHKKSVIKEDLKEVKSGKAWLILFFRVFLRPILVATTILNLVDYSLKRILARTHAVCAISREAHQLTIVNNNLKKLTIT